MDHRRSPALVALQRRSRLLSAAVAILVLGAVTLLTVRALETARSERLLQHRIVAERIFDQMEAELSQLIAQEEERPFLHYRHTYVPAGDAPWNPRVVDEENLARSPLAQPPDDGFLLGYFQVDPDGRFLTPYRPYDDEPGADNYEAAPAIQRIESELGERAAPLVHKARTAAADRKDGLAARDESDALADERDAPSPRGSPARAGSRKAVRKSSAGRERPAPKTEGSGAAGPRDPFSGSPSTNLAVPAPEADAAPDQVASDAAVLPGSLAQSANPGDTPGSDTSSEGLKEKPAPTAVQQSAEVVDSYAEVQQKLNLGASKRRDRSAKSYKAPASQVESFARNSMAQAPAETWEPQQAGDLPDELAAAAEATELDDDGLPDAAADTLNDAERREARVSEGRYGAGGLPAAQVLDNESAGALIDDGSDEAEADPKEETGPEPVPDRPVEPARDQTASTAAPAAPAATSGGEFSWDAPRGEATPKASSVPTSRGLARSTASAPNRAARSTRGSARSSLLKSIDDAAAEPGSVDVMISPLSAYEDGLGGLVLHRQVRIGDQAWSQGFALDRDRLTEFLERRILEASGLSELAAMGWDGSSIRSSPDLRYRFMHRFAEPFTGLTAQLALPELPDTGTGTERTMFVLAVLTAFLLMLGLLAVDRMTAVAVRTAQERSDFTAAVTHELKSPLTAIRMHSEMLESGMVEDEDRKRSYFTTIRGEAERLGRLVDDVLLFARIERGKRARRAPDTALGDCVDQVARTMSITAAEADMRIEVELDAEARAARVNGDAMAQILTNLIANSIKFCKDSGQAVIRIKAAGGPDALLVTVRDHGPGVEPALLRRMFEPFVRGENELRRRTKGTGIGLALVRGLADEIGASVSARNHDEGGLEVSLSLPRAA